MIKFLEKPPKEEEKSEYLLKKSGEKMHKESIKADCGWVQPARGTVKSGCFSASVLPGMLSEAGVAIPVPAPP